MKQLISILLPLFVLLNCASPAPISKLKPTDENSFFWQNGREVMSQYQDSVLVEVAFRNTYDGFFVFDVTIANESERQIIIDPRDFQYMPVMSNGDTLRYIPASDPESKILEKEMKISKLEAERKNQIRKAIVWGTLELVDDIVSEEDHDEYEDEIEYATYRNTEMTEIALSKLDVKEQKNYWENQALRKTTVFPEYFISGKIHLKSLKKAKKIILQFYLDGRIFEFDYDHFLIKVD